MPPVRHVRASSDPSVAVRLLHRAPMLYANGADAELDRPAHVRSASGIAWVGGMLAIVQDDASFVAVVDATAPQRSRAIALPRGPDGSRQFDDRRGNKHLKWDLEACFAVSPPRAPDEMLVAFGSGSTPMREVALIVRGWTSGDPQPVLVRLPAFYRCLREATDFAGSELNVEGAVLIDGTLRLFGRGNGARRGALTPLNATCDLAWDAVWSHLESLGTTPAPPPDNIVQYALGDVAGVPLGFTDAATWGSEIVFTAAAEESLDVTSDGPVSGSAVGIIYPDGPVLVAPLTDEGGAVLADKIEGIASIPGASNELFLVADSDTPDRPSELCRARMEGAWRS